jgi:hypothetical protein
MGYERNIMAKLDTTPWKVYWRLCSGCGGRYLPSATSDDVCGVCSPLKDRSKVVRERCEDGVVRPLGTP